jgi:hypothetical protein
MRVYTKLVFIMVFVYYILPHRKISQLKVQCFHIVTFIKLLGHLPDGMINNQIDHILTDRRWHSSVPDVQLFRAAAPSGGGKS